MSSDRDMPIQLFMQATILLSNYYGYSTIRYSDLRERSSRAGYNLIPFMPPETVRATPELVDFFNSYENNGPALEQVLQTNGGYKVLVKYYIRTGLRAAQAVCRNYLLNLEERNDYLEFLQKEIGVAAAVSTSVLALVNANSTISQAFMIARTGIDGGIDAYQEYRFLNIDREAARTLVEAAQNALAQHYLKQVDTASANSNLVTGGYTFSDALHAVSMIEYQCTRSGIRHLLTRSINNSPSNLVVDEATGTFVFRSTTGATVIHDVPVPPPGTRVNAAPPPVASPGPAVVVRPQPDVVVVKPQPDVVVVKPKPDVVVVAPPPPPPPPPPAPDPVVGVVTRIGDFEQKMKPQVMKQVLTILCRPGEADLGPAGSPTRQALSAFLTANQKTPSEIVTKQVLPDLKDLQFVGKKPAGCT
jgi:hypothetical protein